MKNKGKGKNVIRKLLKLQIDDEMVKVWCYGHHVNTEWEGITEDGKFKFLKSLFWKGRNDWGKNGRIVFTGSIVVACIFVIWGHNNKLEKKNLYYFAISLNIYNRGKTQKYSNKERKEGYYKSIKLIDWLGCL